VWEQDFLRLELPPARFDGVFANAALFHVPCQELPRVLAQLRSTLKPRGVLFSSNPHGNNEEGWNRERYGAYHDLATWRGYLSAADSPSSATTTPPERTAAEQQPWLRGRMALGRYNRAHVIGHGAGDESRRGQAARQNDRGVEGIAERLAFKSRLRVVFWRDQHQPSADDCERLIALAQNRMRRQRPRLLARGHVESADAIHDMIAYPRAGDDGRHRLVVASGARMSFLPRRGSGGSACRHALHDPHSLAGARAAGHRHRHPGPRMLRNRASAIQRGSDREPGRQVPIEKVWPTWSALLR